MDRQVICPKCNGRGRLECRYLPAELMVARVNAGLSLRQLGARLDLSAQYLSDVEHGRRMNPASRTYAELAERWMKVCEEVEHARQEADRP